MLPVYEADDHIAFHHDIAWRKVPMCVDDAVGIRHHLARFVEEGVVREGVLGNFDKEVVEFGLVLEGPERDHGRHTGVFALATIEP
jgi:hypothetical protein